MDRLKDRCVRACVRFLARRTDVTKLIHDLAADRNVDLLQMAYHQQGILKYRNIDESGERHLWSLLQQIFLDEPRPILLDVGANVGEYATGLRAAFPEGRIIAIEPGSATYKILAERTAAHAIETYPIGLSDASGPQVMHRYVDDPACSHASIHRDVIVGLHGRNDVVAEPIHTMTLDDFCIARNVPRIDFLKIDTEGHELAILEGAKSCLATGKIRVIQFEFNEMNVVSRVFLKDFYSLLSAFVLFRLDASRLIPLGAYNARNEIFQFHNIVAFSQGLRFDDAAPAGNT
jgi:FkbM family methyltransferase